MIFDARIFRTESEMSIADMIYEQVKPTW